MSLILALQAEAPAPDKGDAVLVVLTILLIGIAIIGLILVVLVVIWGGRTRRLSREGLPEVRDPDPFAGLRSEARKNERPASADPAESSAIASDESDTSDDD